jgi:hypothetical protein
VAAGESVKLVLSYYASIRGSIPQPVIVPSLSTPASSEAGRIAARTAAGEKPLEIGRFELQEDRSVVMEFAVEADRDYRVHYSEDAVHWKACPEIIRSAGTRVQWVDRGPPWTESAPASAARRFYRVERLNP